MKTRDLIIIIIFMNSGLYCQTSWNAQEAFNFEQQQELYDERGFSKTNSMLKNGNLIISSQNGTVIYNYPLYNQTINGSLLNVELNYCSDVSYTAYILYDRSTSYWRKFTKNRPVWIIGVNGFAVQALSFSKLFLTRPDQFFYSQEYLNTYFKPNGLNYEFNDRNVNWVINGYDVCNKMYSFAYGNKYKPGAQDVIRLLRSDGSVLELRNSFIAADSLDYPNDSTYIGDYYINTPNSKSFAKVNFMDETNGDIIPHNYNLSGIEKNKPFIPRLVRYYPGDGLEYIFYEYLVPFGVEVNEYPDPSEKIRGTSGASKSMGIKGGAAKYPNIDACPSIFYLKEIRNQAQHVAYLEYTKHIDYKAYENPFIKYDNSKGRAFIKSINGIIDFEIGGNVVGNSNVGAVFCNIKTPENNFKIECSNVNTNIYGEFPNGVEQLDYYGTNFIEKNIFTGEEVAPYIAVTNYHTVVPMVSKIVEGIEDKMSKRTFFDYEDFETDYKFLNNKAFFLENQYNTLCILKLKDKVLSKIKEPTVQKQIVYYKTKNIVPGCGGERIIEINTDFANSPLPDILNMHKMHFIVDYVQYIDYSNNILRLDNYYYQYFTENNLWNYNNQTTISTFENSNKVLTKVFKFKKSLINPIFSRSCEWEPRSLYLINTEQVFYQEEFKDVISDVAERYTTYTGYLCPNGHQHFIYDNSDCPYSNIILPIAEQKTYAKSNADNTTTIVPELTINYKCYSYNLDTLWNQKRIRSYDTCWKSPFLCKINYGILEKTEKSWGNSSNGVIDPHFVYYLINLTSPTNGQIIGQKVTKYHQMPWEKETTSKKIFVQMKPINWYFDPLASIFFKSGKNKPLISSNRTAFQQEVKLFDHSIPIFDLAFDEKFYGPDDPNTPIKDNFIGGTFNDIEKEKFYMQVNNVIKTYIRGKTLKDNIYYEDQGLIKTKLRNTYFYNIVETLSGLGILNEIRNPFYSSTFFIKSYPEDFIQTWDKTQVNSSSHIQYYGNRLANDNTIGKSIMQYQYLTFLDSDGFSHFYFDHRVNPELTINRVRKHRNNGTFLLTRDYYTLNQFNGYGSPILSINTNGWASEFDYNSSNSLNKGILPFDFINPTESYSTKHDYLIITGDATSTHDGKSITMKCSLLKENGSIRRESTESDNGSYHVDNDRNLICSSRLIFDNPTQWCHCYDSYFYPENTNIIDNEKKRNSESPLSTIEVICSEEKLVHKSSKSKIDISIRKHPFIKSINSLTELYLILNVKNVTGSNKLNFLFSIGEKSFPYSMHIESADILNPDESKGELGKSIKINLDKVFSCKSYSLDNFKSEFDVNKELKITIQQPISSNNHVSFTNGNSDLIFYEQSTQIFAPYLEMKGEFEIQKRIDEYTVKFDYQYDCQTVTGFPYQFNASKHIKIDDQNHSNHNNWQIGQESSFYRAMNIQNVFGTEFRLKEINQIPALALSTVQAMLQNRFEYDEFGNRTKSINYYHNEPYPSLNPQPIFTNTEYDLMGRIKNVKYPDILNYTFPNCVLNAKPLTEKQYLIDKPTNLFNSPIFTSNFKLWFEIDTDVPYYGVCYAELTNTRENSGNTIPINASYKDALGRLRGELVFTEDPNDMKKIKKAVKYDYNQKNQLIYVKTLKENDNISSEQTTRFWYDKFGRIKYKYQPDLGIQTFAYDDLGNVRFTQNSKQVKSVGDDKISFYEYDDLNRLLIVGEAIIDETSLSTSRIKMASINPTDLYNEDLNIQWLTDRPELKLNELNHGITGDILTSNKTLFQSPNQGLLPTYIINPGDIWPNENCPPLLYKKNNEILGNDHKPQTPFIQHQGYYYEPLMQSSAISNFENIAVNPQNILRAYYYDELPEIAGGVWQHFPAESLWNAIAPPSPGDNGTNKLMNQKGKLAAMAYREHNGQPFNFQAFSYDARGRLIALLRFTDNIGFDATYYQYNSSDKPISIRTVDANNEFITWYDYDNYGRLCKVWTSDPNNDQSKGLCGNGTNWTNTSPTYKTPSTMSATPEIEYSYYSNHMLKEKNYININYKIDYTYNQRFWLDKITAFHDNPDPIPDDNIFMQKLTYHNHLSYPQIKKQDLVYEGLPLLSHNYFYDKINQLTNVTNSVGSNEWLFTYDDVGNRKSSEDYIVMAPDFSQTSYSNTNLNSPNRLMSSNTFKMTNPPSPVSVVDYDYFGTGAMSKQKSDNIVYNYAGVEVWERKEAYYDYDMFGLLNKYFSAYQWSHDRLCFDEFINMQKRNEWRYSYNPFNEREQKRMYYSPGGNSNGSIYPWVHYQLGVNNQQYTIYNGFQISDPLFKINDLQFCTNPYPEIVFMYPVEYNVFGADGKTDLTWTLDNNGVYKKDFQIFDHLGNLVVRARENGANPAQILSRNQYAPFGKKMNVDPAIPPNIPFGYQNRLGFISKEQDRESRLADHGVRKYDYDIGRFTSTDVLFEKYPGWSPYQYSLNNPINLLDWNGKWAWVINGNPTGEATYSTILRYGYISMNNAKNKTDEINSYASKWEGKAPYVSAFLKNNNIRIGFQDLDQINAKGFYDVKLNGNYPIGLDNELAKGNNSELEPLTFHELIHAMGGDEIKAYAAQAAMGFQNMKEFLNDNLGKLIDEGIANHKSFKKFFSNGQLIEGKEEKFYNSLLRYGYTILNTKPKEESK